MNPQIPVPWFLLASLKYPDSPKSSQRVLHFEEIFPIFRNISNSQHSMIKSITRTPIIKNSAPIMLKRCSVNCNRNRSSWYCFNKMSLAFTNFNVRAKFETVSNSRMVTKPSIFYSIRIVRFITKPVCLQVFKGTVVPTTMAWMISVTFNAVY